MIILSDFNNASPADIVAEVRRLRTLLHTYTVSHPETKGLEVVWMMLSDGQLCIDVDTLCSANEKMTGESISEEKAKAKLKELNIAENAIDFDAFVKFFATEKKEGVGLTFQDIAVSPLSIFGNDILRHLCLPFFLINPSPCLYKGGKSEIGPSDLKRALSVEPLSPIFASDELDDKAAEEIIKVASPTGKVTPAEFGALQEQLNKRKLVVEAFKVWDTNGDGQVDLRDIIKTLQSHGEGR